MLSEDGEVEHYTLRISRPPLVFKTIGIQQLPSPPAGGATRPRNAQTIGIGKG